MSFSERILQIPDEVDDTINLLMDITELGRARVLELAILLFANKMAEGDKDIIDRVEKARNKRKLPEIAADALEVAQVRNGTRAASS